MLETCLYLIFDFLSVIEIFKFLDVYLFQIHKQVESSECDIELFPETSKQKQFNLLFKYLQHFIIGLNEESFSFVKAIDIFSCLNYMEYYQSDFRETLNQRPFGIDYFFISDKELFEKIHFTYEDGLQELDLSDKGDEKIVSLTADMFLPVLSKIESKRNHIIECFIQKYERFIGCTRETPLDHEKYLEDFGEFKNFLFLSDCSTIAYLSKIDPKSNVLILLKCNRYGNVTHTHLPFQYSHGIDTATLKQLYMIVCSVNSLTIWKKHSIFQSLLESCAEYSLSENKSVIDDLGFFLCEFRDRKKFTEIQYEIFEFQGQNEFQVKLTCYDVPEFKACDGTNNTAILPASVHLDQWRKIYHEDKFNIKKSDWIVDKTDIQIGSFFSFCKTEIACLHLSGICSKILGRKLTLSEKIYLGTFVAKNFKLKIVKGWKRMENGDFNKFNMYPCSICVHEKITQLCVTWVKYMI